MQSRLTFSRTLSNVAPSSGLSRTAAMRSTVSTISAARNPLLVIPALPKRNPLVTVGFLRVEREDILVGDDSCSLQCLLGLLSGKTPSVSCQQEWDKSGLRVKTHFCAPGALA